MKHTTIKYVAIIVGIALLFSTGGAPNDAAPDMSAAKGPVEDPSGTMDISEAQASRVLAMIFGGRPRQAIVYLDSLQARAGSEPLFLIMRARCHQEFIPMDDANKNAGRELSRPALEDLDRCIDACNKRLASRDPDPTLYFYRGWAWMAKAYVRSMTRDLLAAGREAKRGKKDLEKYLETNPKDPTATGMLGAFLYFADAIPGAFKLISKLLMLPTGDRVKGLEYLDIAAREGGLLETDWKLILYNVYFYFEGRFEEGLEGLRRMVDLHPEYARTAIPLALSRPYVPTIAARNDELVDMTVSLIYKGPHREVDWNGLYLLQLFRAFGDRYTNHTSTTVARLQSLVHESPRHPDWVEGYARLELGRIYASHGRRDDALAMFQSVARGYSFDFLRKDAELLIKDVERFAEVFDGPLPPNTDQWVAMLYRGDPDSIPVIRSRFAELAPRSIAARFYLGECDLLCDDFESARKHFDEVISTQAPAWDRSYQMIASSRIAEIYASMGFYKSAARYQAIALTYHQNEYLLDWVLEGRKKYFERLAEGKETRRPTLLTARPDPGARASHPASGSLRHARND